MLPGAANPSVTRLIIGGHPIYGHSHFNRLLSRYYTDWHTPARLTWPRDELQKLLGRDVPVGEVYLPSVRGRTFQVVQARRKPCLVYKVLAAGRRIGSPAEIRQCFRDGPRRHVPAASARRICRRNVLRSKIV